MSISLIVFGLVLPWLMVGLLAALGAWIAFQIIQQNGRLLARLESLEQRLVQLPAVPAPPAQPAPPAPAPAMPAGLPLGSPGPAFELADLNGGRKSLADFHGKKLLTIFFNPRCGFCFQMVPDLAALPVDGKDGQPLPLVITTGDPEDTRTLFAEHGVKCPVLVQEQMEVASQYQCGGTPMGYLIDEQGRIASEMAAGSQALLALVSAPSLDPNSQALGGKRSVADSKIQRNGLAAGTPAPAFTLPRLDGEALSLEDYRGKKVLLVFSDPKCGPCMALAPQLEQAHRRSGEVQVLMVSRGEVEANRAKVEEHGLTFPVVLQKQWEVSRDYAMFATPVGYLIDEEGIIAADVATGADSILALLANADVGKASQRRCKCGKPQSECGKGDCSCKKQKAPAATARRNGR